MGSFIRIFLNRLKWVEEKGKRIGVGVGAKSLLGKGGRVDWGLRRNKSDSGRGAPQMSWITPGETAQK